MEAIPFAGLNAADDGVVLPFFGDGFAAGDGDEEAVFSAFLVDRCGDFAGSFPFFGFVEDVLES